jgi:2-polyprenyl-3-methyl-5-hydroxy-6-metoxy-1,4-benzoquinol methylase
MKISPHDPALILNKLRDSAFLARINPLAFSNSSRVRARWRQPEMLVRHWTQIPSVVGRINERITGDERLTFKDFVCKQYFADHKHRRGLSLGCGDGDRERDWAKRGVFSQLTGLDLSPERIRKAEHDAQEAGLSDILQFKVFDVNALSPQDQRYDVIIFEHSLHHFSNIRSVLSKVHDLLEPDGLLVIDEFVGPRRFQWTAQQLTFADGILRCLPESYRRLRSGTSVKRRNLRAGEFLMWLNDPSEAVESDCIEAELLRQFKVLKGADYGGTISHLVFHDIAHHFAQEDPETLKWAEMVLNAEDALLDLCMLRSDFACFVCAP